ncbi:uncharacterized protein METZ01_LOCUS453622, partial [marine metagenome]
MIKRNQTKLNVKEKTLTCVRQIRVLDSSGGRIRTYDLRVMSPT